MDISLPVTLAVLGAALLHATWNVLVKAGADKELETINIAVGSGLLALIAALLLPAPARASCQGVAASAVVHILYFIFLPGLTAGMFFRCGGSLSAGQAFTFHSARAINGTPT